MAKLHYTVSYYEMTKLSGAESQLAWMDIKGVQSKCQPRSARGP